jgi:hypothetical protein
MTLGLTDKESRDRFVCPFCGMVHNWIHGCNRPKIECPKCGRKLKIKGREDLCFCQIACYGCKYSWKVPRCKFYNEYSKECEVKLFC